ncbi:putative cytokinetic ring protein SteA [Paenibacillus sp. TRM 82003]|uniref:putative cytokinetic ring protein SteA n=1 Tax=Kineococcus sp. TRM81007 TaxID=2925831 RepID=UPI001F5ACF32|nr:putative cytokinetic ring protein SteA [Kineococcus sp. TRM81007]MCI2240735.1 putative cytokinetic ring protein SteA [Kineococcus sp. TRM81007]MCI3925341.1 putative cytokinetic ring protein SteA [Paenibacillus sp. TRM 82003]
MSRRRWGRGPTRAEAPGGASQAQASTVQGTARVDRRTKTLTKRLRSGEIAVIDHLDLDRVSAEALVACGPAAVVNASASTSGRYPNLGPEILVEAGVPVLDAVGTEVMTAVAEGARLQLVGDELRSGEEVVARGRRLTPELVAADMEAARAGLSLQLEAFAANTMEYLRRERELLLDGVGVPDVRTRLEGRHVLIVVRGYHYKEDLVTLRSYVREYKPVLIGVDGGADAILEAGWKPDMIVGDMDSVSDAALRSGAEVVVHAYRDGRAPGLERVRGLGIDAVVFPATGTSEDVAMLLADDKGATLIAAVGTHVTLVEFLDKGRAGMASTFLTRLRVGGKLVDAKGVSRLYQSRVSDRQVLLLVLAGVLAFVAALAVTPTGQAILAVTGARLGDAWAFATGLLTGDGP